MVVAVAVVVTVGKGAEFLGILRGCRHTTQNTRGGLVDTMCARSRTYLLFSSSCTIGRVSSDVQHNVNGRDE